MLKVEHPITGLLAGEYRTVLATDGKKRMWGVLTIGTANEWSYKFVVNIEGEPEIYYSLASAIRRFDQGREAPEPECRCYCVGDQADASECPVHGRTNVQTNE